MPNRKLGHRAGRESVERMVLTADVTGISSQSPNAATFCVWGVVSYGMAAKAPFALPY